jgi:hypothetical protein
LYYAVIGVAISSLTDRRIVAGASIIGLLLVTSIAAGIFVGDPEINGGSAAALVNVLAMPLYLRDVIFLGHIRPNSPLSGVDHGALFAMLVYIAVVLTGAAVLLRRYRWVEK